MVSNSGDASARPDADRAGDSNTSTVLEMLGIDKAFPGVQALTAASFELRRGEIHALVGENGAGKSTLIKILTGVYPADVGIIRLSGQKVEFRTPIDARRSGIAAIYQEFTLVNALPVRANLFLGREKVSRGTIDVSYERNRSREIFERLGVKIDADTEVNRLNIAQQQLVEVARALLAEAAILVMDEPTAALTPREVERLFVILRDMTARGISVIFVSHRFDEVYALADRITVMRDGHTVITCDAGAMPRQQLIEHMVGRPIRDEFPKTPAAQGQYALEVRHVSGGPVRDVSFWVRDGEVLGIAGLVGSGRTDLLRLIFGADRRTTGEIMRDGLPVDIRSPRDAIRHGICMLTEDRKAEGLVLSASAKDNFALPNLGSWSRLSFINHRREVNRFVARVDELQIRTTGPDQPAAFLSGGNQQKLLVARWLETDSQVIMFDEPTRGIDVGAKYEMYVLISRLAAQGKAIVIVSSELPEILGISDRVLVMRRGQVAGEITNVTKATQEEIMALAV
ncbi:MAG: sugar ABC transporter ATP-binding protein [candidate division Zixibacteria bacterium]|nr:sugar ABC transporter ATP-binding protein [candidate division Zixibacteria bacterium]